MHNRPKDDREDAPPKAMSQGERIEAIIGAPPDVIARVDDALVGKKPGRDNDNRRHILLKMGEAADLLNVSRTTLWRLVKAGRLPRVELLPGSFRIRLSDIDELVG